MLLVIEQVLNGLQFGILLFLLAAGLTLIFGIMDVINLAHGSLYMMGAYFAVLFQRLTGSFVLSVGMAVIATFLVGIALERLVIQHLYRRSHLDQVLATFGIILFMNEGVRILWGAAPLFAGVPPALSGHFEIISGVPYSSYRLLIIGAGLAIALGLYLFVAHTRTGMLIRAGASNREMVAALGVNIRIIFTVVFGLGAGLAGLSGLLAAPLLTIQPGMGETILILTFVVIVIGGLGSIRGAFLGALIVGMLDLLGRAFLRPLLGLLLPPTAADAAGPAFASMLIYVLMAFVLFFRPSGLFASRLR
jgi:branched-chain amino acid transport system permease protein